MKFQDVEIPALLAVVLLCVAQAVMRSIRVKRKENEGKRHDNEGDKFNIFIQDDQYEWVLLDDMWTHIMHNPLKENNQTLVCVLDTIFKKIQKKNTDFMGPLSKLWHALKIAVSAPNDETDFTITDLLNLVQ